MLLLCGCTAALIASTLLRSPMELAGSSLVLSGSTQTNSTVSYCNAANPFSFCLVQDCLALARNAFACADLRCYPPWDCSVLSSAFAASGTYVTSRSCSSWRHETAAVPANEEGVLEKRSSLESADSYRREILNDVDVNAGLPYGLNKKLLPRHVAIIMDGNSRWAQRKGWPVSAGHEAGVRVLREVMRMSCEWGIQVLTVFAFSAENWFRPQVEVRFLMNLFEKVLKEELPNFVKENIQVHVIGDVAQVPKSLQGLITFVEKRTEGNTGLKLIVAVGYGGRRDIVKACQQVAAQVEKGLLKPEDITESILDDRLETSWIGEVKNPDLLIRTSGEQRLSNFLLWQLAYTELVFVDSFWPEFGETQYANALLSYQQRLRRFGRRVNTV
eukprot:c24221_g1_i2 orf=409-1569(-)